MSTLNFPARRALFPSNQFTDNAANEDVFTISTPHNSPSEPVVVFFPSGNYNQLTELGRYKNLSVAMSILSFFNHPESEFKLPEYQIFSLETGDKIQLH